MFSYTMVVCSRMRAYTMIVYDRIYFDTTRPSNKWIIR